MKKVIGFFLLILGLCAIFYIVWESYQIFNAKKEPPQVFEAIESISGGTAEEVAIQEQIQKVLPLGSTTKLMNLISWSIFAAIIVLAGSKISGIGTKMMRGTKKPKPIRR